MKKRIICLLLMCSIGVVLVGCGKDKEAIQSSSEYIEEISSEVPWVSETENGEEVSSSVESTEVSSEKENNVVEESESSEKNKESETVDSSKEVQTEEPIETNEPIETDEPSSQMVSEEDLVHVVVPEENKGVQDFLYSMAAYKVEGDIAINENIDFGITLDSDDVRKLITLIYEGTGCTSHKVLEEHFAIFDYDENDYSAYIELSDGSKYGIYLVNGKCYAIKDEF